MKPDHFERCECPWCRADDVKRGTANVPAYPGTCGADGCNNLTVAIVNTADKGWLPLCRWHVGERLPAPDPIAYVWANTGLRFATGLFPTYEAACAAPEYWDATDWQVCAVVPVRIETNSGEAER